MGIEQRQVTASSDKAVSIKHKSLQSAYRCRCRCVMPLPQVRGETARQQFAASCEAVLEATSTRTPDARRQGSAPAQQANDCQRRHRSAPSPLDGT